MIYRLCLSVEDIINNTINQSSQDFRGLRTQKGDIDIVFEDFVITADDRSALVTEMKNISASIYQQIKGYVCNWYIDDDLCFYIKTNAPFIGVDIIINNIVVYALLAWWYETRLPELSLAYREKVDAQISALISAVTPKFAERRLRMF
jgi:hypothetical protein